MRDAASSDILAVWKRAAPRNRMREILTSGSVGGLAEQSLVLPGHYLVVAKRRQHIALGVSPRDLGPTHHKPRSGDSSLRVINLLSPLRG